MSNQRFALAMQFVVKPWAIIWRPLVGASKAVIPDIPFPDSLELAQPCLQCARLSLLSQGFCGGSITHCRLPLPELRRLVMGRAGEMPPAAAT
jgi:hypothetical protein